ncbi:hypothetical protein Bbelb_416320 [Branchiostoma belcheri]|nr:hypothetical protein Bbelb_416320 [Branchiostoma belcheri]
MFFTANNIVCLTKKGVLGYGICHHHSSWDCKSRSEPYRKPHGSRRETDRAPDGSLTETGRQGDQNTTRPRQGAVKEHFIVTLTGRRTHGVMTPAGVYTENMPNGRRFTCDLSINVPGPRVEHAQRRRATGLRALFIHLGPIHVPFRPKRPWRGHRRDVLVVV